MSNKPSLRSIGRKKLQTWTEREIKFWRREAIEKFEEKILRQRGETRDKTFKKTLRDVQKMLSPLVQDRMSLDMIEGPCTLRFVLPKTILYALIADMESVDMGANQYLYKHFGSWSLPNYALHAKMFVTDIRDAKFLLGDSAVEEKKWKTVDGHYSCCPADGPAAGGVMQFLCSPEFPITLSYNLRLNSLCVLFSYAVRNWKTHSDGSYILGYRSAAQHNDRAEKGELDLTLRNKRAIKSRIKNILVQSDSRRIGSIEKVIRLERVELIQR